MLNRSSRIVALSSSDLLMVRHPGLGLGGHPHSKRDGGRELLTTLNPVGLAPLAMGSRSPLTLVLGRARALTDGLLTDSPKMHPHLNTRVALSTTSVLAAAALAYTLGAGITAAAGTRLALQ